MKLPWKCPTEIDKPCKDRHIIMVGWVLIKFPKLIREWGHYLDNCKLGRCKKCGREHFKSVFYWHPMSELVKQPEPQAKTYNI